MTCPRCGLVLSPFDTACTRCNLPASQFGSQPASGATDLTGAPAPAYAQPGYAPAGYAPPGQGPNSPENQWYAQLRQGLSYFRPLNTFAIIIYVIAAIEALLTLMSIKSSFDTKSLVQGIISTGTADQQALTANDTQQALLGLATFGVYVTGIVFYMIWINRAHKNLMPLGNRMLEFTPAWAVGWYFVPFANLVRPFQVMREIMGGSDPDTLPRSGTEWQAAALSPIIGLWWGGYIISNVVANIQTRMTFAAKEPQAILEATQMSIVSDGISLVAMALWIAVVMMVTKSQHARHAALWSASSP